MEALILLAILLPLGLFAGWCLGIAGWRQAHQARREIAELRAALAAAGIALPGQAPAGAMGGMPDAAAAVAQAPFAPPGAMPAQAGSAAPPPDAAFAASETGPGRAPATQPVEGAPAGPPLRAAPGAGFGATPPPAEATPDAAPNPWALPGVATAPPPVAPAGPGLEAALTQRWGVWLGAAAILLAGVFLIRTAVEEGWLGPVARCALAALLALALVAAAEWLRRRPVPDRPTLPWPDQAPAALAAGGAAVLFGAAYGAAVLYALVPPWLGFLLLAAAACAALALALVFGPVVAAIGIAGAYLTPALVQTEDPSLPGLFAYLLVVTAAALLVVRQVAAAWLGWAATLAGAFWVVAGGVIAGGTGEVWAPALFVPAAAALHLALLPRAALESGIGRRLAWLPFAVLAGAGLLLSLGRAELAPAAGILLLTPVAVWQGRRAPALDRMPWLAALAGLLLLLAWTVPAWSPSVEAVTVGGVVQAILPAGDWPPEALRPFLGAALLLALMQGLAGLWGERRAPRPLHWAALPAAVPVLALLVAYARVAGFATDLRWALAALALAAVLVGTAAMARREDAHQGKAPPQPAPHEAPSDETWPEDSAQEAAPQDQALARAGIHAAGAVAALALAAAMLLAEHWLTLAIALFLPPLAWIEARARLPALRPVALVVALVVLARLLLNEAVLGYAFGAMPLLNGLLAAYGAPAASFALAAALFRRRGDDALVAVLEAGACALLTALVLLEIRHAVTGGELAQMQAWGFREQTFQLLALALLAALLRLLDRRLGGRPVLGWAWRLQQVGSMLLGLVLILGNPAFEPGTRLLATPVLNELLLAYALPAGLAALAARAPETRAQPPFRLWLALYALLSAFAWVTLEVRHEWHPVEMALALEDPAEAELWAYSGAWLGFGAVLLALGIRQALPALRLAALAVLGLTILKVFLVDMAELGGLWRVMSFLGLGLALIALGWVYRRFVGPTAVPAPAPPG